MDGRMYLRGHAGGSGLSPGGLPHPKGGPMPPSPAPPAECHEAVLDDVALCLGERAATGQAVYRVKHGVHHDGTVLSSRKEWCTLGDEWQHRQAQVAVQCQCHLCGTESGLGCRVGTSSPLSFWGCPGTPLDNSGQMTQASHLLPKPAPLLLWTVQIFQTHTKVEKPINETSLPRLDCSADFHLLHVYFL